MAVEGDPEDDLPLDPPENEDEQVEDQETETEETEADPEEAAAAEPGTQDPPGEARQPTRGERRFQTLSSELQEQRRRNDELSRRLDTVLAGQPRQQGESPEQRVQRLALLTPEERITETLRESEVRHAREMQGLQFAVLDGNDKAAFEAKATVDPLFAKWKPRVETELATLRQQGQNVDREKLMYFLIGKNAVEGRKEVGTQRRQAQARVNGQRTRPSNAGSDTAPNRRDRNTSLERRLENQSI